ncbi:MFS transporter [Actinoalloteichus sp. GBA129-24]|uniref:MFS transporter n=1 Tax=Actinoalloteichus sp. GBA129-24 TaxID=1612551 RepID=UPI000950B6B6|nr:MFS transporter [Actinoalloteichus sp. GBA129-24]APU21416.1 arabinose efflux permease family protein [Actinoalloteichus sp. GBA129-24]
MGSDSRLVNRMLVVVFTAQFLVALDISLVNIALPSIQEGLGFTESNLHWVVNAYLLTFSGFLLLGGRLGDVFGRRRVLLGAVVLFGAASLWAGLATHAWELGAARAIQGLAAAGISPVALALITVNLSGGPVRARALALWGAGGALGGAAGVLLSGLLTEFMGWRWVMLINLPIVAVLLFAVLSGVRESRAEHRPRLDVTGAVLVTTGMSLLILGVLRGEGGGWTAPDTALLFVFAVAILAVFVLVEHRAPEPLMPLTLFTRRAVLGANLFGFLLSAGQLAGFFFVSLYLQRVLDYSPALAGAAFLPFCAGTVVGLRIAMRNLERLGPRTLLLIGGLTGAAGLAWFAGLSPEAEFLTQLLGPSMVCSVGIGVSFVAMGAAATSGVPARDAGTASAVLNSSRQLGGSVGLAVLVTAAAHVTSSHDGDMVAALAAGYSTALALAAVALAAGALLAVIVLPRSSSEPSDIQRGDEDGTDTPDAGMADDRGSQADTRPVKTWAESC